MEQLIIIKQLTASEKRTLKKMMREKHGNGTKMAAEMDIPRPRLNEAINGDNLSVPVLNAIRKFLSNQKTAA